MYIQFTQTRKCQNKKDLLNCKTDVYYNRFPCHIGENQVSGLPELKPLPCPQLILTAHGLWGTTRNGSWAPPAVSPNPFKGGRGEKTPPSTNAHTLWFSNFKTNYWHSTQKDKMAPTRLSIWPSPYKMSINIYQYTRFTAMQPRLARWRSNLLQIRAKAALQTRERPPECMSVLNN